MIDTESAPGSWAIALQPDHRSLRTMSDRQLHAPNIIDQVMQWHGLKYAYEARDMIAAELKRRKDGE